MQAKYPKELEDNILSLYAEGLTTVEIAKKTGLKYNTSVRRVLLRHGITPISTRERLEVVKSNPFTNLQDSKVQYWLGYLAADGCISTKKGSNTPSLVRINTNKDPDHLLKYIDFLGYPVKRNTSHNKKYDVLEYCVGFSNKDVCTFLIELGYTPAKSLSFKAKFKFSWDFIRGYFDGNGYGCKSLISIATGSKDFSDQIMSFYNDHGLTAYCKKQEKANCFVVNIYDRQSRRTWADSVYGLDNSEQLCLERKKEIVLKHLLP